MDHNDHDHSQHMGHNMPDNMSKMNSTMPPMAMQPTGNGHHDSGVVVHNDIPTHHGSHSMHNMDNMGDHMMKMYFHCSSNATILFEGWKTTSWETMLGSCIAVFIMAAMYEGLKVGREFLLRRTMRSAAYKAVPVAANGDRVEIRQPCAKDTGSLRMLSMAHGLQTLLHLLQIVISYFLMLIFMTYNIYLCIAVALGAATGYFVFSWKRAIVIDINDHCH